jgi:hypothetical protein
VAVQCGPVVEFTQDVFGRGNPRGGSGTVACPQCHRSPWWRVAVVCIVSVVRLGAWCRVTGRLH